MNANANIHKSIRYDRAVELREQLQNEIAELVKKAETADAAPDKIDHALPDEIARRRDLKSKMDLAIARLEARAKARAANEQEKYENRKQYHDDSDRGGRPPQPPSAVPRPEEQTNLTDADSRIMRKNKRSEYRQAYNPQIGVDADGTQLILGAGVSQSASDANELVPIVDAVTKGSRRADYGFGRYRI